MTLTQTKSKAKKILKILSSLKFAIFILLIIAAFSILGTVIEQNQTVEFYKQSYPEKNPLFGFINWKLIRYLSLDNVYRSWWYLSLLIVLGSSLILCSFTQQLPMLKRAKIWKFFDRKSQFKSLDLKLQVEKEQSEAYIYNLSKETYNIFQYNKSFFCYKGIIGKISPIVVHISIIQIFIGAIVGALFGFGSQEVIPKGEIFHMQNILNAGILSETSNNLTTRVNNFWIDYTNSEAINQFYSDISLLDGKGNEVKRKVISVNNPLHYKDITIYQSDWDISCLRIDIGKDKKAQYETKKIKIENGNRWLTNVKLRDNEFNFLIKDLNKKISVFDKSGNFIQDIKEGEELKLGGKEILSITEIVPSTGLEIKSDPGIPLVYTGFVFLILSTLLSFVSFSNIWIFEKSNNIYVGATSNRAKKSFEQYFLEKMRYVVIKKDLKTKG